MPARPTPAVRGLFAGVFDVEAAGEEEIGGVPTVHYEGTIDLTKACRTSATSWARTSTTRRRSSSRPRSTSSRRCIDERIPFEMWIDEENLPRRMKISMDFGDLVPGSDEAKMDMTVDYSNFGEPVHVQVPAESEVTDLTDATATQGGASGGADA